MYLYVCFWCVYQCVRLCVCARSVCARDGVVCVQVCGLDSGVSVLSEKCVRVFCAECVFA